MPQIKLIEFNPIGSFALGNKILYFEDAPGGMSYSVDHLNPVNARRTQDGTLITATIRYNKKEISLTITFYDVTLKDYFQALYESGFRSIFKIWVENPSTYIEETEFDGTVQILSLGEDNDQSGNVRTLNMALAEA
jgi:hypothetical protein